MAADAADDELRLVQAASGALYAAAEQANRAIALQATAVEMQKAADEARMMAEIQVGGRYTGLDCKQKTNGADCSEGHARQCLSSALRVIVGFLQWAAPCSPIAHAAETCFDT